MSGWPFGNMQMFGYDFIMADSPWLFTNYSEKGEEKNATSKYACMDLVDVKSLPVGDLAKQNCVLWLWATNPLLREAFEVIDAWGFKFKTAGHWVKRTVNGKLAFGTGYLLRCSGEPFLIGTIGNPSTAKNIRSVVEGPAREHSRKPDEAYREAEKMLPGAARADLFSRQIREGWTAWGNEIDKFERATA